MARTIATLPAGRRITDYLSLGVIAKFSVAEGAQGVTEDRPGQCARARLASACSGVLRDCLGLVQAVLLPRGAVRCLLDDF
jgi:hypothetical protein